MKALLFVSNGHGEAAIADAIAAELNDIAPDIRCDHLALVGRSASRYMQDVGPQRTLPSGGLIAMGNLVNIARDVGAGLIGLVLEQRRFLHAARDAYAAVVAVGDTYAYAMSKAAHLPAIFVGTAKSVSVAPYGPLEERMLRSAVACFVRDEPTAERLRSHGVDAVAANAIVDLFVRASPMDASAATAGFEPSILLLPGSRENAYNDARRLAEIVERVRERFPLLGAVLSVAPGMDPGRFARALESDGWTIEAGVDERVPFAAMRSASTSIRAWKASIAAPLRSVTIALGQAGTANEEAAAAGVPVVALERRAGTRSSWYRHRQRRLLGDALMVLPDDPQRAADGIAALIGDPKRRALMAEAGKRCMGAAGGARKIAERIVDIAGAIPCAG